MTWPTATYRLQFGEGMTFADAAALAPYFSALGISHLYASPVFEAAPGSTHGYDLTDPNRLSRKLGGEPAFRAMTAALSECGIGLILDIVPNHMAASPTNPWLTDVMVKGPDSEHAAVFDIDWAAGDGCLVLPVLGDRIEACLSRGEITLQADERWGQVLQYYDQRFPVRGGTEGDDAAEVHARQAYRLTSWRDLQSLNYRRFFDITGLIGVRQEDPEVFAKTHRLVGQLVKEGLVHGLRVDHIDGLRDPHGYLDRLAGFFPGADPPPIWVEKILEAGEELPASFRTAGETGYASLHLLDQVFVDRHAEALFDQLYKDRVPDAKAFPDIVLEAKKEVAASSFASEFAGLAGSLAPELGMERGAVEAGLHGIAVNFSVYRTYARAGHPGDQTALTEATARAGDQAAAIGAALQTVDPSSPFFEPAMRFQQLTGPVMAKGVEDTSFYRDARFVALNEVGGDPGHFGLTADAFHAAMETRAGTAMTASATHDTKRGESMRLRLLSATHLPALWERTIRSLERAAGDETIVDPLDRYFMYQTAMGFWAPQEEAGTRRKRLSAYAMKAAREAKRHTAWTEQNAAYEDALASLAERLCRGEAASALDRWVGEIAPVSEGLDIARLVLKLTIPGIPDIYQGTEFADHSLVDPDNRRPVDFAQRRQALASGSSPRLEVIRTLLSARRDHARLFAEGSYTPLSAPHGHLHFARSSGARRLTVQVRLAPGAAPLGRATCAPLVDHAYALVTLDDIAS